MSEIESSIDRSIAAYWLSVASKGEGGKSVALEQAAEYLRAARSEAKIPYSAGRPTMNEMDDPPVDVLKGLTRYR